MRSHVSRFLDSDGVVCYAKRFWSVAKMQETRSMLINTNTPHEVLDTRDGWRIVWSRGLRTSNGLIKIRRTIWCHLHVA